MSERGRVLSKEVVDLLVKDQGFGHTMGFGYFINPSPYGQASGYIDHLGRFMTYFWLDPREDNPLLGVFLSQRVTNVLVNSNMTDGMKVVFSIYVALVESGHLSRRASSG
jgi:hypothetical protein